MLTEQAKVLSNEAKGSNIFLLRLEALKLVRTASAGQFVQVLINNKNYDPLLRRPFCFHQINKSENSFDILYQVVGKGTTLLSEHKPGTFLDVLGPLGNGFNIDLNLKEAVLIGGGMGIAPLYELGKKLNKLGIKPDFFFGVSNKNDLDSFNLSGSSLNLPFGTGMGLVATIDGSCGYKGLVTELLEEKGRERLKSHPTIFACGPTPMLNAVQTLAEKYHLTGQMSLEARMACGFGVCLGCAVEKNREQGYYKVCKDGPVFDIAEVKL